jgi:hypothetical protein
MQRAGSHLMGAAMMLDPSAFLVHDVRRFPFVSVHVDTLMPDYETQWEFEMAVLLAQPFPFAVIHHGTLPDETEDARVRRTNWLVLHRAAVLQRCKIRIFVESDAARRAMAISHCRVTMRTSGMPNRVVATLDEAYAIASHRLATADCGHAPEGGRNQWQHA